jgi:hypothetical protein
MKIEWSANDIVLGSYVTNSFLSIKHAYQIGYIYGGSDKTEKRYCLTSMFDGMICRIGSSGNMFVDLDEQEENLPNNLSLFAKRLSIGNFVPLSDKQIFDIFRAHFISKFQL